MMTAMMLDDELTLMIIDCHFIDIISPTFIYFIDYFHCRLSHFKVYKDAASCTGAIISHY